MWTVQNYIVLYLIGHVMWSRGDDQFTCCMTGVKTVRNVVICPAPCCYGYKQRTVFATKLARITFCEKIPEVKEIIKSDDLRHFTAPNAYDYI